MQKTPFLLFSILAYSLALQTLSAESSYDDEGNEMCMPESRVHRLSVSHREGGGIGYNKGYTSLDAFFSMPSKWDMVPFFDFRAHVFNDGKWAANAGLGIRKLLSGSSWIIGGNAFYDYRHVTHTTFNQVGFGLELLGTKWDFHGNAYIPVGHNRRNYANPFKGYAGHFAFFTRKYEFAFAGADVLAGRELWSCDDYLIRGALGAYFLKGHFNKKAGGGLVKLTAEITNYVHIEGQLSYDNIFKWKPQGELRINIPIGKKIRFNCSKLNCCKQEKLSRHIVSAVDRFEIIPKKNKKKSAIALDPVTGQPVYFIFVNNMAGDADGSFDSPFPTLSQALAIAQPGDVISVFEGNGTTTGLEQGATLQDNQQLAGSSMPMFVKIKGGRQAVIPEQTVGSPMISNPGGAAITLGNGNTIQGFNITSAAVGISGTGTNGATIKGNTFNGITGKSVNLQNANGTIAVSKNHDNGSKGTTIDTASTGSANISITDNNVTAADSTVTPISLNVSSRSNVTIANNMISNGANLIDILINSPTTIAINNNMLNEGSPTSNMINFTINSPTTMTISNNILTQGSIGISGTSNAQSNITLLGNIISQMQHEGIDIVSGTNSLMNLNVTANNISQTSLSAPSFFGITILSNAASSQITLNLIGNSSFPKLPTQGYELENDAGLFFVKSPNGPIGLQSMNAGNFPIIFEGPILFIP